MKSRSRRISGERQYQVSQDFQEFERPTGLVVYELRELKRVLHWISGWLAVVTIMLFSLAVGWCTVSFE